MEKGTEEYIGLLETNLQWCRQRIETIHRYNDKDCWYWQGDGEDHIESMVDSLPVVITAGELRKLLKNVD